MPGTGLTGVGYYTLYLMRALFAREDGFEFRLFASSAQAAPEHLLELGRHCARSRIVRWPTRIKIPMWTRLEWPPIEWLTGPVDIAHGGFHLLPPSRKARRAVTIFDLTNLRRPETHSASTTKTHVRMIRHATAKADALIAISKSCKTDLIELVGADPDKVHVVYGGVALDEFSGTLDAEALAAVKHRYNIRREYFIHLGTLEPRKNIPRLLEAYDRIRRHYPDCPQLVLAGRADWKCEAIFETIESLGLQSEVVHTGYLAREEAVLLLRGAHACLYPSLYEGFGLPVLEAMAARTPVLTSNVSSLPEVIGDTGIQVDPESVDTIEAGITDLIEHRHAAIARLDAAYARAQTFTWENSAKELAALYKKLA